MVAAGAVLFAAAGEGVEGAVVERSAGRRAGVVVEADAVSVGQGVVEVEVEVVGGGRVRAVAGMVADLRGVAVYGMAHVHVRAADLVPGTQAVEQVGGELARGVHDGGRLGEAVRVFIVPLRLNLSREAVGEALLEDDVDRRAFDVPFRRRGVGHLDAEDAVGGQRFDVKQRGRRVARGGATVDEQGGRLIHCDEADGLAVGRFQAGRFGQQVEGGGEDLRFREALRREGQAAVLNADGGAFGSHHDLAERLRLGLEHDRPEVALGRGDGARLVSQVLHAQQVGAHGGVEAEGAVGFAHGRLDVGGVRAGEDEGGLCHGLAGCVGQSAGDALLCASDEGE